MCFSVKLTSRSLENMPFFGALGKSESCLGTDIGEKASVGSQLVTAQPVLWLISDGDHHLPLLLFTFRIGAFSE